MFFYIIWYAHHYISNDKTDVFKNVMKEQIVQGEENEVFCCNLESFIESSAENKQFAFGIILMEDDTYKIFKNVYPVFRDRKHSEEILLVQMDTFLSTTKKKIKKCFIYTYNSPCLTRDDENCSCMSLIVLKSFDWHKRYKVVTVVAYTIPWGLSGPSYFKSFSSKDIFSPNSPFKSYVEECENIPYKLDLKNLKKIFENHSALKLLADKDSESIKTARETLLQLAEGTVDLKKNFLHRGYQEINSIIFETGKSQTFLKKLWNETVTKSFESLVREYITDKFNKKVLLVFRKELNSQLENPSFFQLYKIPPKKLKDIF